MATQKHTKTKQRRSRCALAGGSKAPAFDAWMTETSDSFRAWGIGVPTNPNFYARLYEKKFGVRPVRSNIGHEPRRT